MYLSGTCVYVRVCKVRNNDYSLHVAFRKCYSGTDIIGRLHCWYIEPRNREKSLRPFGQRFSCLLDEWIAKISKKKIFFTVAF